MSASQKSAIHADRLTKFYGKTRGVEDVSLDVHRGEVFGFLGPNGAGKSTTIRVMLDLLRPTSGSVSVLGLDPRADSLELRRRVGYLPGDLAMYDTMTARQLCTYFSGVRGVDAMGKATELAHRLDLDLDRQISNYSTGNRQKVGLVQALMHEPELLILDEPTSGLDPLIQQEFYAIVSEAQAAGSTIFLSSHVLPEVERIAERVAIIRDGSVLVVEEVASLKARAVRRVEIHFGAPVSVEEFAAVDSVLSADVADDGNVLILNVEGSMDPVVKQAARHEVRNIISHNGDLEDVFLAYYRGEVS